VFVHVTNFGADTIHNDGDRSTHVDVFRLNPQGRICEHWDVRQMRSESRVDDLTVF
jgi:predicted SnoaL-like aldol condensation-catalyzing enzyme